MLCPRCSQAVPVSSARCPACGATFPNAGVATGVVPLDTTGLPLGATFGPSTGPSHVAAMDLGATIAPGMDLGATIAPGMDIGATLGPATDFGATMAPGMDVGATMAPGMRGDAAEGALTGGPLHVGQS